MLTDYPADFARDINDEVALRVSVTRALNLLRHSGLPRERFIDLLFKTRSRTKEASASIRKTVKKEGNAVSVKAKMPFFATLEQLCGAPSESSTQLTSAGDAP